MLDTMRRPTIALLLAISLVCGIAACGSSSDTGSSQGSPAAQSLLNATFSGAHAVKSGVLGLNLTVTPSGSSTLKGPISLGLNGPFQSRGAGNLPESNLAITVDALGHHGQLGIISTGTAGYVTLRGNAYRLPAAEYQKLASSFAGAGSGTGGLAKLGIKPLHWLTAPHIVGSDSVQGTPTTHIRARVNVSALLSDVQTFLQKAAASGATGSAPIPTTLSPATRAKIAAEIRNATVDIWTGASDKTLRKLAVNLNIPVSGTISSLLGGLSSAGVQLTLQYAQLNQPQSVATPANVKPFTQFTAQLRSILGSLQGLAAGGGLGGATGSGSTGSGTATSGAGSASGVQKYSQCILRAGSDVAKMQRCAPLLNGG